MHRRLFMIAACATVVAHAGAGLLAADSFPAAAAGTAVNWPDTPHVSSVSFLVLRYDGRGWDAPLDPRTHGAENLMAAYRDASGFTAPTNPLAVAAVELPATADDAPPFVYMTGTSSFTLSTQEIARLRAYLLDGGGMLWADAGSPDWDIAFRAMLRRVLFMRPLQAVADDDPLFLAPYCFPAGAPPLAFGPASGSRMLGVRHRGRWVVIYSRDGMGHGWRAAGSGLDPLQREAALNLGVNLLHYTLSRRAELDLARRAAPGPAADTPRPAWEASAPGEIPGEPPLDVEELRRIIRALDEARGQSLRE